MRLTEMLRRLGDRLGVIELSPTSPQSVPIKVQTRTITLAELVTKIRVTEVRELAETPKELSVSFDDVFKAAGIQTPPTGWTVKRLEEFLKSDKVRGMDRAQTQQETARKLAEDGVDSADVIKDAISRDQALDAFEESLSARRQEWRTAKQQLLSALATQIRAIEEQKKSIEKEIAFEEKGWTEWRERKRQLEKDMAHAVSFLVNGSVISIEDE